VKQPPSEKLIFLRQNSLLVEFKIHLFGCGTQHKGFASAQPLYG